MFRSPFQPVVPDDFEPVVERMAHPGEAWLKVYASGGNLFYPDQDRYTYNEFKESEFPKIQQAAANASLSKEARYHGRDIDDYLEIVELLPNSLQGQFIEAVSMAAELDFEPFFYTHRLGILVPSNGVDEFGRPPMGIVVGFSNLPASDRNNRDESPRTSVRKFESVVNFALSPNVVLATMEQKTIWEGFVIEPVFSHNGPTMDKLRQNEDDLMDAEDDVEVPGGDPITIG